MGKIKIHFSWGGGQFDYEAVVLFKYFVGKNIIWTFANPTTFKHHNNIIPCPNPWNYLLSVFIVQET